MTPLTLRGFLGGMACAVAAFVGAALFLSPTRSLVAAAIVGGTAWTLNDWREAALLRQAREHAHERASDDVHPDGVSRG